MKLFLAAAAIQDLDDTWLYIAREDVAAADGVVDRVLAAAARLVEHPEFGRERPEIRPGLRSWPVPPMVIFYFVAREELVVARVLHGRRDIDAAF